MNLGIIIQARTGSKRFPRKVLKKLDGIPVIQHVINRCLKVSSEVILAVPFADAGVFSKFGIRVAYGPEDDVLERYFIAANDYDFEYIVRITGDCPLIPPRLINQLIDSYMKGGFAYGCVDWPNGGYPKGYGVEIFDIFTLRLARTCALTEHDREHVTPWMREHCRSYMVANPDGDQSHLNFCVDYPTDIARLEAIIDKNKT